MPQITSLPEETVLQSALREMSPSDLDVLLAQDQPTCRTCGKATTMRTTVDGAIYCSVACINAYQPVPLTPRERLTVDALYDAIYGLKNDLEVANNLIGKLRPESLMEDIRKAHHQAETLYTIAKSLRRMQP